MIGTVLSTLHMSSNSPFLVVTSLCHCGNGGSKMIPPETQGEVTPESDVYLFIYYFSTALSKSNLNRNH